jgi:hypothetical protein
VKVIKVPTWNVYTVNGSAGFLTPSATGIDPKIENEVICDPIQGNVPDCFFIAALGSCAWNTTVPRIPYSPPNFAPNFTIPFWWYDKTQLLNLNTVFTYTPKTVSNTLLLGANGMPIYAQPTPQNEIWVAIYEKAFAVFAGCPCINGNPDISILPTILKPGDALSVLVNLTKKKFSFTTTPLPQTAFKTTDSPPSTFNGQSCYDYFDIIKTVCVPNAASPSSGKTNKPMVAWTYDTVNLAPPLWQSRGLQYRNATNNRMLVAQHTYSILGYYTFGGSKYIVLRDPLGTLWTTPQSDTFIRTYLPPAPSNWDPVQDHSKCTPRDLSAYPCGVFGLRVDAFTGCFSGFGWVQ